MVRKILLFKGLLIILISSVIFFSILIVAAIGGELDFGNDSLDNDYAIIYYSNPAGEFYVPFNIGQLVNWSKHKFIVGNRKILDQIHKKISKINVKSKNKKKGLPGYFFKLTLYVNSKVLYNLRIQRDRSFIWETINKDIPGVMDEDTFNYLVALCESMSNVIDYEYQWKRLEYK